MLMFGFRLEAVVISGAVVILTVVVDVHDLRFVLKAFDAFGCVVLRRFVVEVLDAFGVVVVEKVVVKVYDAFAVFFETFNAFGFVVKVLHVLVASRLVAARLDPGSNV